MEAQLRRIWPRRKSLKRATKPAGTDVAKVPKQSGVEYNISYEAAVSGPPPQVGSLPLKPSDDIRSRKSFGYSKAQSAGLQEFRTISDIDTHSRAQSMGGIQPILVGISRPIASSSAQRATASAGSGYVDAPQTPAGPHLDRAASQPETRRPQKSQSAFRRYVDILSFAPATEKHLEAYNEEVAARNLDLKALANESATTTYMPMSKYQEDIAYRNAASMGYRYKASAPMQSLPEGRRPNSQDTKMRPIPAPHTYKHEGVAGPSAAKARSLQDSTAYHSRNGSATSKNSSPLPAIPQEFFVDGAERAISGRESRKQYESSQRREEGVQPQRSFTRYPSMHASNAPRKSSQTDSLPPIPKLNSRANESRPMANGNPKEHLHPLYSNPYEAPATDDGDLAGQRPGSRFEDRPTRRVASKSPQNHSDDVSRRNGFSPSRTSSTDRGRPPSSLHQKTDSSSRTYLDLTGNEPEKLSKQESPYIDYMESPVLAQATADMLQVRRAQIVGLGSYRNQDAAAPLDRADYGTPRANSLQAPKRQSKRWSGAFSDTGSFYNEQPLAFSAVSTVSSVSPTARPILKFNPAAESSGTAESREITSQGLTSHRVPFSDIARPGANGGVADQRRLEAQSLDPQDKAKAPAHRTDTPPKAHAEQQNHLAVQTPQMLHTGPESLTSGDFVDPNRSFGVKTRDFAATPSRHTPRQKSPAGVPVDQQRLGAPRHQSHLSAPQEVRSTSRGYLGFEHKSNGLPVDVHDLRPISPQLDHVDTPQKELTASTFDEAEFARKQAQARAALLRLQMSLEEQYDMFPGRPDSSTKRHVARQILDQNRRPRPEEKRSSAAPTSMYYEKKDYQSKAKANRPPQIRTPSEDAKYTSGYVYEKQGSKSFAQSVYSTVTVAPTSTAPTTNGHHVKSSGAGSAGHSYNYANANASSSRTGTSTTPNNPPLTPVLPSPSGTEVSLSSFPMPQSPNMEKEARGRRSHEQHDRPRTARMHSTKSSVNSMASVYSIPHHMVPVRDSSRRDQFDEEAEAW